MSVRKFNRGQLPEALAKWFGLKGDVSVDFQETLVPVVGVGDVVDSPYMLYGVGVMGANMQAAGGAAEYSAVGVRPGSNVALQVHQVVILNTTGASVQYNLRQLSAANIATVGVGNDAQLVDVSTGDQGRRSSSCWTGTHTALVGDSLMTIAIPAGESQVVTLPRGGVNLFGSNSRPGLAVFALTLNTDLTVGFYAREWPLPG